jgi:hypothetical protein
VESVYCAVRTEVLHKTDYISSLKGYYRLENVPAAAHNELRSIFLRNWTVLPALVVNNDYAAPLKRTSFSMRQLM